jgi:predicted alpha-1,6-mannanase (GH76 family)
VVSRISFTYNQGTFIGAADALYQVTHRQSYRDDALRALRYTRSHLTRGGILQNDASTAGGDWGGFKAIFARYAVRFTRNAGITDFDDWFRLNAATAWAHRNRAGLVGYDWTAQTPEGRQYAWDCSSAVAIMEALLP